MRLAFLARPARPALAGWLVACASQDPIKVNEPSSPPPMAVSPPEAPPSSAPPSPSQPPPPAPHDAVVADAGAHDARSATQPIPSQGLFHSAANQAYCIDAAEDRSAKMTPVRLFTRHGGESQRWTLSPDPTSTTTIVGIHGLCLGLHGSPPGPGARAHLDPCTGAEGQAWTFDTSGRLRELKSGKCLTISKAARGTPIRAERCDSGNPGQVWSLAEP